MPEYAGCWVRNGFSQCKRRNENRCAAPDSGVSFQCLIVLFVPALQYEPVSSVCHGVSSLLALINLYEKAGDSPAASLTLLSMFSKLWLLPLAQVSESGASLTCWRATEMIIRGLMLMVNKEAQQNRTRTVSPAAIPSKANYRVKSKKHL